MQDVKLIVTALLLLGGVGCASIPLSHDQCNATKFQTAMEHEACLKGAEDYVQEQFAAADRRIVKRDKIIAFLNACSASSDHVIVETIRSGRSALPTQNEQRKAKREYGYAYTHENVGKYASLHNFQCATPDDIKDALRRMGL